ncbi:MAG TPA: hypothetical protein ENN60_03355 [archaeon]|nr:hypothetical protein [archaeon]
MTEKDYQEVGYFPSCANSGKYTTGPPSKYGEVPGRELPPVGDGCKDLVVTGESQLPSGKIVKKLGRSPDAKVFLKFPNGEDVRIR